MPFDSASASHAAVSAAQRKALGRPVEIRDILIAGIAASSGATLATRNMKDFEGIGLALVNPWIA